MFGARSTRFPTSSPAPSGAAAETAAAAQGRARGTTARGLRRAHIVVAPLEGGVVHHVLDVARFDPGGSPLVVLPPWPGLDRAAARCEAHGVPVLRLAPPPRAAGVCSWLDTRPVDLVHVHYAAAHDGTPVVQAALAAGIAVVTTDHACPEPAPPAGDAALWDIRRRAAARQATRLADSRAVAGTLARHLGLRVRVVAHGIDTAHFERVPARQEARRGLGIAPNARVVASLGALFSSKGMHRLVEAVAALGPSVTLVVAGEGPERPRLVHAARGLGVDLLLPGWMEDVRPLLAACDVFALASDSEGLPSALLQAMAAGVPVVATATPGTCEAAGDTALLVAPGDLAALARGLEAALHGALNAGLAAARARVRGRFEARRLAARVSRVHAAALGADAAHGPPPAC